MLFISLLHLPNIFLAMKEHNTNGVNLENIPVRTSGQNKDACKH